MTEFTASIDWLIDCLLAALTQWMMLISDMALIWDPDFREHLLFYNSNRTAFFRDSAKAWKKLIELGCDGQLVQECTPNRGRVPEGSTLRWMIVRILDSVPEQLLCWLCNTPCTILCFIFLVFAGIIIAALIYSDPHFAHHSLGP